jgi:hypothetical protein
MLSGNNSPVIVYSHVENPFFGNRKTHPVNENQLGS